MALSMRVDGIRLRAEPRRPPQSVSHVAGRKGDALALRNASDPPQQLTRLSDITALVDGVGPRLPGSTGERRAAELVQERLAADGIPSTLLPVRTSRGEMPVYVALLAMIALGVPLAYVSAWLGFLVAFAGTVLLGFELATFPLISRYLMTRATHNVLGMVPAAHYDERDEPELRVILTAHLDTPRGVSRHALAGQFRPFVLAVLVAAALMPVALLLVAVGDWLLLRIIAGLDFVALGLTVGAITLRLAGGPPSPGASDNASGVAAVLGAVRALDEQRPRGVETWALLTAGAEDGLTGTIQFLQENAFDAERTYFIDVDRVGAGTLCYARSTGIGYSRGSSATLTRIAEDAARTHPEWKIEATEARWFGAEFAALVRGYQAIALTSCRPARRWRDLADTMDNLQIGTVEHAAELLVAMIRAIDTEPVHGTRAGHAEPVRAAGDTEG